MPSIQSQLLALGRRIEAVIEAEPNQSQAMDEIALTAERRGLIESAANLRRESPQTFVKDLWVDNPATLDRLNLQRSSLPDPLKVKDLPTVLDVIP